MEKFYLIPYHVAECLEISDVKSSIRNFNDKQVVKVKNSDVRSMHFRKLNNAGENSSQKAEFNKLVFIRIRAFARILF